MPSVRPRRAVPSQHSAGQVVCETGFAEKGSNKFVPIDLATQPNLLHNQSSQHWPNFALRLRRAEHLLNIRSTIRRLSNVLPENIEKIYEECEQASKIKLDSETRKTYYREFSRMAQGFAVLQHWEVEMLIGQLELGQGVDEGLIQRIMHDKIQAASELSGAGKASGVFDFHRFIYLVVEVIKDVRELQAIKPPAFRLRDMIPIDPGGRKAYWDFIIFGFLIYCCFEVPFSAAFDTAASASAQKDAGAVIIDTFFMADIVLNFLTAFDRQGYLVRDLRDIARNYLRTW